MASLCTLGKSGIWMIPGPSPRRRTPGKFAVTVKCTSAEHAQHLGIAHLEMLLYGYDSDGKRIWVTEWGYETRSVNVDELVHSALNQTQVEFDNVNIAMDGRLELEIRLIADGKKEVPVEGTKSGGVGMWCIKVPVAP